MSGNISPTISKSELLSYSKEQLIQFIENQNKSSRILQKKYEDFEKINNELITENIELKKYNKILEDKVFEIEGQLVVLRNKLFRKKSEKTSSNKTEKGRPEKKPGGKKKRAKPILLPSEKYPEAAIIERHIEFKDQPHCSCCGFTMEDSGMTEDSEYVTVVPK